MLEHAPESHSKIAAFILATMLASDKYVYRCTILCPMLVAPC